MSQADAANDSRPPGFTPEEWAEVKDMTRPQVEAWLRRKDLEILDLMQAETDLRKAVGAAQVRRSQTSFQFCESLISQRIHGTCVRVSMGPLR